MNYTKLNNTYFAIPKDDSKDRIAIEVGDSKQDDFYPQVKIKRWDNEVNFSARLVNDEKTPKVSKSGDKIRWQGKKVETEFYPIEPNEEHPEGGHEFEVILKEKPVTNKIEFTLETKGLDFFYQPELTKQEIKDGAIRPENVVGSYAVYCSENKTNWVGGKLYRAGKVGHIYRPKITDSVGSWIWGELSIDKEAGLLTVTIPQIFLNRAVYPVKIDPTFGYTTAGATYRNFTGNMMELSLFTSPADVGTATSISGYFYCSTTEYWKAIIVLHSSLNIVTNGIGTASLLGGGWRTSSFATPPSLTANTDYLIGGIPNPTGNAIYIMADAGSTDQEHRCFSNSYASPTDPSLHSYSHYDYKLSFYCTYTAVGGWDLTVTPSAQSMALSLKTPAVTMSKTIAISALALVLALLVSSCKITNSPSAQTLSLSLPSPTIKISSKASPATQTLSLSLQESHIPGTQKPSTLTSTLTLNAPLITFDVKPSAQSLSLTLPGIKITSILLPATQELTLNLRYITIAISIPCTVVPAPFEMNISTHSPNVNKLTKPSTLTITSTLESSSAKTLDSYTPATRTMNLVLFSPIVTRSSKNLPSAQTLTLSLQTPTVQVAITTTTQTLALTLNAPTIIVTKAPSAQTLTLALKTPSVTIGGIVFSASVNVLSLTLKTPVITIEEIAPHPMWTEITRRKTDFNEAGRSKTDFSESSRQKTAFSDITKQKTDFDEVSEGDSSVEQITYGDSNTMYGEGDCRYNGEKLSMTWPAGRKKTAWGE